VSQASRKVEREPVSETLLKELLNHIPADDRGVWLTVLGAVKLWGQGTGKEEIAFQLADEWARQSAKYDETDQQKTWDSLNRGEGENVSTIGTLFHLAKDNGWKGKYAPPDHYIVLPSGAVSISNSAEQMFKLISPSDTMFYLGGCLVEAVRDKRNNAYLEPIKPDAFRSRVEKFGILMAWRTGRDGEPVLKPTTMSLDDAKAIVATTEARDLLPHIGSIVRCPVLVESADGELKSLYRGYHPHHGGVLIDRGDGAQMN
jgi:hypothetical protein